MPRNGQFGTKELTRLLKRLGFVSQKSVGSSHQKWAVPKGTTIKPGQRPFIIVVKNKKSYMLPTCNGYIKQIKSFGFDTDELCN